MSNAVVKFSKRLFLRRRILLSSSFDFVQRTRVLCCQLQHFCCNFSLQKKATMQFSDFFTPLGNIKISIIYLITKLLLLIRLHNVIDWNPKLIPFQSNVMDEFLKKPFYLIICLKKQRSHFICNAACVCVAIKLD